MWHVPAEGVRVITHRFGLLCSHFTFSCFMTPQGRHYSSFCVTRTVGVVSNRKRDLEVAAEAAELLLHGVNLTSGCQKVVHLPLERREGERVGLRHCRHSQRGRNLVSARAMAMLPPLATRFELEGLKSALRRRR